MASAEHLPTVGDVLGAIDRAIPLSKAGGWDPVGLQVGDASAVVGSLAVCHEAGAHVVERCVAAKVDLLVSYHPLLFRPSTTMVAGPGVTGRAVRLLRAGTSLIAVHTAFDVAPGGVADALAAALELHDVEPFGLNFGPDAVKLAVFVPPAQRDDVAQAMAAHGAGVIGKYTDAAFTVAGEGSFTASDQADPATGVAGEHTRAPELRLEMVAPAHALDRIVAAMVAAHPYEEPAYDVYEHRGNAGFIGRRGRLRDALELREFAAVVEDRLGAVPRVAGDPQRPVTTVAAIPGSGRSFLRSAAPADVVVTGDVGHHDARSATDRGQAIIDPGHAPTERPGMTRLYSLLREIAAALDIADVVDLTQVDANPWSDAWRR